jgi:endonuclease/exonuclease/phosphatase family metal-dependent hydrolase
MAATTEETTPLPLLPEPGEIVFYDYRHPDAAVAAGSSSRGAAQPQPAGATSSSSSRRAHRRAIRLAQFNVERGYELERVIDELKGLDADVIALQEVDVGCERSAGVDVGRAVARALGLCGFFLCEFHEHHSALRDARSQGGGAHGNAILSRYDLRHARRVDHQHHPVDWNLPPERQPHALARREPRSGQRAALAVRVFPPWLVGEEGEELDGLLVYSAHLEVFCGVADRAAQFGDLVADALRERKRELVAAAADDASSPSSKQQQRPWRHAILGDLNTMAHGVARLSPHYAHGPLRWRTLGLTEAEWWERHVLWRRRQGEEEDGGGGEAEEVVVATRRQRLVQWGVPADAARALVPNPGFACPFPARETITLDNPSYRLPLPAWAAPWFRGGGGSGQQEEEVMVVETARTTTAATSTTAARRSWIPLMAGKLDWVLLHEQGFSVERAFLGNGAFAASDHAWLAVDAVVR